MLSDCCSNCADYSQQLADLQYEGGVGGVLGVIGGAFWRDNLRGTPAILHKPPGGEAEGLHHLPPHHHHR